MPATSMKPDGAAASATGLLPASAVTTATNNDNRTPHADARVSKDDIEKSPLLLKTTRAQGFGPIGTIRDAPRFLFQGDTICDPARIL